MTVDHLGHHVQSPLHLNQKVVEHMLGPLFYRHMNPHEPKRCQPLKSFAISLIYGEPTTIEVVPGIMFEPRENLFSEKGKPLHHFYLCYSLSEPLVPST